MGVKDFLNKITGKSKKNQEENNTRDNNEMSSDIILKYRSGDEANVLFEQLENVKLDNGTQKLLQKLKVIYIDKNTKKFEGKEFYMEPEFDENGNNITKEKYLETARENMPLAKGFLQKEQVNSMSTNYIGKIGYKENGKPYREKDDKFERGYKQLIDRIIEQKIKEENSKFRKGLEIQVNNAPDCYEKVNHAEELSNQRNPRNNKD